MSRQLHVRYEYRRKEFLPEIRFSGKYLARAGFQVGDTYRLDIKPNQLILVKETSHTPPSVEVLCE